MNVLHDRDARENGERRTSITEGLPVVVNQNGERKRNGIWLLTHPRSASNLFQTMLATQSKFRHSGYWFFGESTLARNCFTERGDRKRTV